jgi:hypothetical protein
VYDLCPADINHPTTRRRARFEELEAAAAAGVPRAAADGARDVARLRAQLAAAAERAGALWRARL